MKLIIKMTFLFLIFLGFARPAFSEEITLKSIGGIHKIPVTLNGLLTLDFVVDTGASDVILSDDVTDRLVLTGAFDKKDLRGHTSYEQADGSLMKCRNLIIRSVRVGTRTVENVLAGSCPQKASLLLGQSFWSKLGGTFTFKKKGEMVVAFASGEPIEAPAEQATNPPVQVAPPTPKVATPKAKQECNFEMEKFINAPSMHDANNIWSCTVGMGMTKDKIDPDALFFKLALQVFDDGTVMMDMGDFNATTSKWKKTNCDSLSIEDSGKKTMFFEDISGDSNYGVVSFTVRLADSRLEDPTKQLNMVCVLEDWNIEAQASVQIGSPDLIEPSCKFIQKAEIKDNLMLIKKTAAKRGATHAAYEGRAKNNDAIISMYECPADTLAYIRCMENKSCTALEKSAERGNAQGQFWLGEIYQLGAGFPLSSANAPDLVKAIEWYQKAAAQGHAEAQYKLGEMYEKGEGVTKDLNEAVELYQKAATQGHVNAQWYLGLMYESGERIPKDLARAVKWYQKAAAQGDATAQNSLGEMYERGEGVPKDLSTAIEWYKKAAAQGDGRAQYNLQRLNGR